jgi:ABC-type uncharacterized transport system substrate-binding protein
VAPDRNLYWASSEGGKPADLQRREFIALIGSAVGWPLIAHAQHPIKVPRIGYLGPTIATHLAAFQRGLADLGWVEGRTLIIEIRVGKYEQFPDFAAELVRLNVDLIFAVTTPGALAAKQAAMTKPIVIGWVADPVESGLVASLAHPGGNITGWTHQDLDLRANIWTC